MEQQYINSKLYAILLEKGGYQLIAMYAMLLNGREGSHYYAPYKNSNNKITKGKRLISKKSGVSLTALNNHLQTLLDMDVCHFTENGGFFMNGKKSINNKYKKNKRVPIQIGKNLRITTGNAMAVMLYSNAYSQMKMIDKKKALGKALRRTEKGLPVSVNLNNLILKAHKEGMGLDNLHKVENIILSNQGIVKIVNNVEYANNKKDISRGGYIRKMMEDRGLMFSRRRYKTLWDKTISYEKYLSVKPFFENEYGFVTYKNGRIKKPIASEIMLPNMKHSIEYNTEAILKNYEKSTSLPKVSQNENRLQKTDALCKVQKTSKKVTFSSGEVDFIGWLEANPEINKNTYKEYDRNIH